MQRSVLFTLVLATTALTTSGAAIAGSFALREQSTRGQGLAFAGVAAGSAGLSSIYWNPAWMSGREGMQFEANASAILPYSNVTPQTGTSPLLLGLGGTGETGDIGSDTVLPSLYASYQLGEKAWLGLATNTPFGLSTKYEDPYAGQIYAKTSRVFSFNVNPSITFAVNDWLSIGAGMQVMYFSTDLSRSLSPVPYAPTAQLSGDDVGFGGTAGITITPFAGTEIGLGYRSPVGLNLTGDLNLQARSGALPAGTYPIEADITLPEIVTFGLRQQVTEQLALNAGFEWTNWSRLGTIPVKSASGPLTGATLTNLSFEYNDGYYASVGAEFDFNERWSMRGGLAYEWSPITTANRDLRLPDSDRVHAAVGASYTWKDKLTIDLAYTHIFTVGDGDVELTPGNPSYIAGLPFVGSVDSRVDLISIGASYKF